MKNIGLATAGFEDGGRGHKPRNVGGSRSWKRQENGFSPRSYRRN